MRIGRASVQRMVIVASVFGVFVACSRQEAPQLAPAAAPPPPPPPAPVVKDAGADAGDAATDAGDAGPIRHAKKAPSAPAGGGSGALKVEGSLPRAEGDKVLRAAQPKLRACFEQTNPGGKGGRVSFKLTVDDRGHVTLTEISKSTLPGGSDAESCMVHVLRDLRFPRATGETTLSFQSSFGR